jgi:hypothetical protein
MYKIMYHLMSIICIFWYEWLWMQSPWNFNIKFVLYCCCSWKIATACLVCWLFLSKLFSSVGWSHRGWQEWDMTVVEATDLINFILFIWVMRDQKHLYITHKMSRNSIMHKWQGFSSCQWYSLPYLKHFFCCHVS